MAESLNDLINAIQHAVIEAQEMAEDHHIDLVSRFFKEDPATGQTRALTQDVWVPDLRPNAEEGGMIKIAVPLISLASLGAIRIKELRVEFEARLSSLDTVEAPTAPVTSATPATPVLGAGVGPRRPGPGAPVPGGPRGGDGGLFGQMLRGGPRRNMAFDFKKGADDSTSTVAKISIVFEGTSPPEGIVRLNDQVLKSIP